MGGQAGRGRRVGYRLPPTSAPARLGHVPAGGWSRRCEEAVDVPLAWHHQPGAPSRRPPARSSEAAADHRSQHRPRPSGGRGAASCQEDNTKPIGSDDGGRRRGIRIPPSPRTRVNTREADRLPTGRHAAGRPDHRRTVRPLAAASSAVPEASKRCGPGGDRRGRAGGPQQASLQRGAQRDAAADQPRLHWSMLMGVGLETMIADPFDRHQNELHPNRRTAG